MEPITDTTTLTPTLEIQVITPTLVLTTPVELDMSSVISVTQQLTEQQLAAWSIGADTFGLLVATTTFLFVFGVLGVLVAMMRVRWLDD